MIPKFQVPSLGPENLPTDEMYRILFSNIERRIGEREVKSIAVTSTIKGEGKTTTTIQISKVVARDFKKRVLLLEGDLNNPQLQTLVKTSQKSDRAIDETAIPGLDVMTLSKITRDRSIGGPIFANGLKKVIGAVGGPYDFIFVDCPPVLPLVDMQIISGIVDGIVMIVKAEGPPRSLVSKAIEGLPKEKILGVVLNGIPISFNQYGYGYGYGYGDH